MTWTAVPTRAPLRLLTLLLTLFAIPAALAGPVDEAPTSSPTLRGAAVALERVLATVGADRWHAAGQRGRGMTVAVLDSGFRGWHEHLGAALPPASHVRVRSFRDDANFEARNSQ